MATRIESFSVTIPKNTPSSAPVTVDLSFNPGQVDEIEIDIPPGSAGLMSWQLAYGDQSVIPHDSSQYITVDDTSLRWPLTDFPTGSGWAVTGYNTDIYDHTFQVRFLITEIGLSGAAPGTQNISAPPSAIALSGSTSLPVPS